jgi:hypothetical protein
MSLLLGFPALDGSDAVWNCRRRGRRYPADASDAQPPCVVFVDSDLVAMDPLFVVGLLGPLLTDPTVGYVKALYDRPLTTTEGMVPRGGGRVTELLAARC